MKKALLWFVLALFILNVVSMWMPQAKAISQNTKIMNVESINGATGITSPQSVVVFKNAIYVGTENRSVLKYSGAWGSGSWSTVVTWTAPNQNVALETDGNHLIATCGQKNRIYYTGDGISWTYSDLAISGMTPWFSKAWIGNGTVLGAGYTHTTGDYIYLFRSDDYGATWSTWKNLSASFPLTTQKLATGPVGIWKHAHTIAYSSGYIAVSVGDTYRTTVVSKDDGATWSIEQHGAPTNIVTLSDRMVFLPDNYDYLQIYYFSTQKYKPIRLPEWREAIVYWSTYDSVNDVIYADIATTNQTTGIIASPDKGESWVTIYKWTYASEEKHVFPFYYDGYVYFVRTDQNKVYRFESISNAALKSAGMSTQVNYALSGNTFYHNLGNASQVVDATVSWTKLNLINMLNNSGSEEGMKTPYGNGYPYYGDTWGANATGSVVNGVGMNGTKGLQIDLVYGGDSISWEGAYSDYSKRQKIPYNYGVILMAYIKLNRTDSYGYKVDLGYYYNATFKSDSNGYFSVIPSTDWVKYSTYVEPPSASSGYWYGYPKFRLLASYNLGNMKDIPATRMIVDNATVYPIPHHFYALGSHINYNNRMIWTEKITWVNNGSILNTATPIVNVNDAQIISGQTITTTIAPLKIEVEEGGLLQFTITKMKDYIESDSAITSATIGSNQWSFTVFASSGQTSTTKIYCGTKGEPTQVLGATSSSYDSLTQILTVSSNDAEVTLNWWTFTGHEGAEALIGLVPFVWIASILSVCGVMMFSISQLKANVEEKLKIAFGVVIMVSVLLALTPSIVNLAQSLMR